MSGDSVAPTPASSQYANAVSKKLNGNLQNDAQTLAQGVKDALKEGGVFNWGVDSEGKPQKHTYEEWIAHMLAGKNNTISVISNDQDVKPVEDKSGSIKHST